MKLKNGKEIVLPDLDTKTLGGHKSMTRQHLYNRNLVETSNDFTKEEHLEASKLLGEKDRLSEHSMLHKSIAHRDHVWFRVVFDYEIKKHDHFFHIQEDFETREDAEKFLDWFGYFYDEEIKSWMNSGYDEASIIEVRKRELTKPTFIITHAKNVTTKVFVLGENDRTIDSFHGLIQGVAILAVSCSPSGHNHVLHDVNDFKFWKWVSEWMQKGINTVE